MLSASKMDGQVKDQAQTIVKPTLLQNDELDGLLLSLRENVQSIQQDFDSAWANYQPENQFSQICYITSNEGALGSKDTQIQSLLSKFKSYQSVEQIQADFSNLREYWLSQCRMNRLLMGFGESYLISLRLMEALFICAFMDNLSYVINSRAMSEPVFSVEAENKVDVISVADQVLSSYVANLHEQLFKDKSNALINELLPDVVELNRKIDLYHDKIKKVFKVKSLRVKPLSVDDNQGDDKSIDDPAILQLLSDELAYSSLLYSDDILSLKATQQELINRRNVLLNTHNKQIDEFLTKIRAADVPVQVNYDAIKELSPLMIELRQTEASIALITEQNTLKSLEADAVLRLKEAILANKELGGSLRDFADSKKPGLVVRGKEPLSAMWKMYDKKLKHLAVSPQVLKIDHFTLSQPIEVTKWEEKKANIIEKLEKIKIQAIEIVKNHMLSLDFHRRREEIIKKEGEELRHQASSYREMQPIPVGELEIRRAELDKQWEVLLATEANLEKLKVLPKKLFEASKEKQGVKKDIFIETGVLFNKKLAKYRSPVKNNTELPAKVGEVKEIPQLKREESVSFDNVEVEDAKESQQKNLSSDVSISLVGSVQYASKADDDKPINLLKPKPKRHWYAGLVDKPWKRAVLVGLGIFLLAGLAATGVGLALEASWTLILAVALGGGVGLGLFSGATYACISPGSEPPASRTRVTPENASVQNDLIDRRRAAIILTASAPSVFPVHAPNSLYEHKSPGCFDWFLRRRKDNRAHQLEQKPLNQLGKANRT